MDPADRGREARNCRCFWTGLSSSRIKSINCRHRDPAGGGRETQKCRRFWTRLLSSRLKVSTAVTGIRRVVVAKRRTVVTFGLVRGGRGKVFCQRNDIRGGPSRTREEVLKGGLETGPDKMSRKEVVKEALRRCRARRRRNRFLRVVWKEGRESISSQCEVLKEILGGCKEVLKRDHERGPEKMSVLGRFRGEVPRRERSWKEVVRQVLSRCPERQ